MKKRISMGIPEKWTYDSPHMISFVRFKGISPIFLIVSLFAILFIIAPIQASLVNGTYYQLLSPDHPPQENNTILYYRNITPQNNPREYTVKPGDTIYLGGTYDLTYVMGSSKQFAWWKNWKVEGMDCTPDLVTTVSYIETNGAINPKMVYIDPAKYKVGNWWQWDGCYIDNTYEKDSNYTGRIHWLPYIADNNLAFRIIYPPVTPTKTPTPTVPPIIRIPIKTLIPTSIPTINLTPEIPPVKEIPGLPWLWIIIGIIVIIIVIVVVF